MVLHVEEPRQHVDFRGSRFLGCSQFRGSHFFGRGSHFLGRSQFRGGLLYGDFAHDDPVKSSKNDGNASKEATDEAGGDLGGDPIPESLERIPLLVLVSLVLTHGKEST